MSGLQLAVLAVVQGITEFLPISSQAHLILVDEIAGWPDAGLLTRVAVHVGTLGAVTLYFRRDVGAACAGFLELLGGRPGPGGRLALHLLIATVPVVVAGGLGYRYGVIDRLQAPEVIGWTTLGFGVALYGADRLFLKFRKLEHMTYSGALVIGVAQVFALVPGTSRSGVTITAARALGFTRSEAARFSMLLSIPVIAAAGALEGFELYQAGGARLTAGAAFAGAAFAGPAFAAALSFAVALAAIGFLMRWLRRASFTPFVVYRVALGIGLLAWHYA